MTDQEGRTSEGRLTRVAEGAEEGLAVTCPVLAIRPRMWQARPDSAHCVGLRSERHAETR